jgi:IS1 family transposase
VDEIWAFVGAKQKNVRHDDPEHEGWGDVWTWVALDPDTKLVPSFRVGARDAFEARELMMDLSRRLAHRVQLTTDGHKPYLVAVDRAFDGEIDYAQLVKIYRNTGSGRYSSAECIGAERFTVFGAPDPDHIGTSHVERQNLHMRMSMRRFTRLTNAFSKKVENLACAVALHFTYYNFCRAHSTLGKGVTPAMAAGVADHMWSLQELIGLLEAAEATPIIRGPYRKTRERQLSD